MSRKKTNNTDMLIVRLDTATKQALYRTADQHDISAADFVRQMIRSRCRPEAPSMVSNRDTAA